MQIPMKEKERAGQAFFIALLVAALLFLPFMVIGGGRFFYYGDFNAQQIPFYQMAHDSVRAGDFFWNWTTDLGANFIGSYSFYLLGSPFFWLTIPFPSAAVTYLMGPLLILKFACASWTAYLFCRRFVRPTYAVIAGILYAFSGFSLYNVFFNHFHEAIVYFPLMLWALEQYMDGGKRGLFALVVCLSALNNYYFFIGQAIFLLLYFGVRMWSRAWTVKASRVVGLFWEAIAGTAMAGVLLLPSFYAVIQNSRTERWLSGWDLLIYRTPQRLWDVIHSFFFPPDIPARPNFFPDAGNNWASMSAWLPLFGCSGVIAYWQSRSHTDWLRRMLTICFVCAVIPVFNAMFQLFNEIYYARWYYMMVLLLALATVSCLDRQPREDASGLSPASETQPVNWKRAFGWSFGVTAFFAVLIGLAPASWEPDEETGRLTIGLMAYVDRFWIYVGVALAGLLLAVLLVKLNRRYPDSFSRWGTVSLCIGSLMIGWYILGLGKANAYYPATYLRERVLDGGQKLTLPETEEWSRIDTHKDLANLGMYWQMPSIQAFQSIVPGSVMEFYNSVGVPRSVHSEPDTGHYALRSFLSVKWLFDYDNEDGLRYKEEDDFFEKNGQPRMLGFTYVDTQNGYRIYRNDYFLPMGFTYTAYVTRAEYDALQPHQRELLLLKALIVEEEQVKAVAAYLPHFDLSAASYYRAAFLEDVAARGAVTADTFEPSSRGFTSSITLPTDNVVFFSVPYENGWRATVNGQPAEIIRADVGFMAVACPAGENTIRFSYETPGLRTGFWITCGSAAMLTLYVLFWFWWERRERPAKTAPLIFETSLPSTRETRDFWRSKRKKEAEDAAFEKEFPKGFDLYSYYNKDDTSNTSE